MSGTRLDAPWPGGLVEDVLHDVADGLPLREDLGQRLGAEDVPQRGGDEQVGRVGVVAHVADGRQRVRDLVEADGVHRDRHRVAREHLLRRHLVRHRSQVDTPAIRRREPVFRKDAECLDILHCQGEAHFLFLPVCGCHLPQWTS